jgi:NAD dependent epimerase/dehydratase family enzyme
LRFGEFADTLFESIRLVPAAAQSAGFEFQYPDLASALATS